MKKLLTSVSLASLLLFSSCATLVTARVDDCQITRPSGSQPARKIRPWAFLGDLAMPVPFLVLNPLWVLPIGMAVCLGVDFAHNTIYKPCPKPK